MVEEGDPAKVITRIAADTSPDLLIMGTHGRRGISRLLSGSVAEAMLRWAPCPVLTVRAPVFGREHERIMPIGEEWFQPGTQGET